jgi:hypothetical protein
MTQSTPAGAAGAAIDDHAAAKHDTFVIVVNGTQDVVGSEDVSYAQVVKLAYPIPPSPDARYTVTFRKAKGPLREGSLAPGESVQVKKEGTIFNVKTTGKS